MTDLKLKSKSPEKLKEISGIPCKSQDKHDNPGVLSGISGFALAGGSKYARCLCWTMNRASVTPVMFQATLAPIGGRSVVADRDPFIFELFFIFFRN